MALWKENQYGDAEASALCVVVLYFNDTCLTEGW